jgi:peroxiredoxin
MIRQYDVAYFMISVDSLEDNTAFAKKEDTDFPILADPTRETARNYGVLADFSKSHRETSVTHQYFASPSPEVIVVAAPHAWHLM